MLKWYPWRRARPAHNVHIWSLLHAVLGGCLLGWKPPFLDLSSPHTLPGPAKKMGIQENKTKTPPVIRDVSSPTHKSDMPASTTLSSPKQLLILSAIGFSLLWGLLLCNGTLDALFVAKDLGIFPDGRPLRTVYTGWKMVDETLVLAIAFFDVLTNKNAKTSSLFLFFDLCTALAAINTWVLVESRRRGVRNLFLRQ